MLMRERQTYLKPTTTVLQMDVSHALMAGSGQINKFNLKVDEENVNSSVNKGNPDDIDANKNNSIWSDEIWK